MANVIKNGNWFWPSTRSDELVEIQGAICGIMIPDTLNWNRAVWEPQIKTFLLEVVGTILGGKMVKLSGGSWSGAPQPSLEIILLFGLQ